MATIKLDVSKKIKSMKPMHGGGQPPLLGSKTDNFHYLTEAGIPYSRLHDVAGAYGGGRFVDVGNLFRDFDADENDPVNYDFAFTDYLIKGLVDAGVEPYYRLGCSIETSSQIKAYRILPPKDFAKWAGICEHIIMHYTEGWADGFHYNIKYWEIWNEPEVRGEFSQRMMWAGTDEEFYELYHVAASHLKARFPHLKIGGFASCGFYPVAPLEGVPVTEHEQLQMDFFEGFFKYIKEKNSPIDFFSWHSYSNTKRMAIMDKWLHGRLSELGYGDIETHLNEWNNYPQEFGTSHHSAETAATMIAMQCGYADVLCIYDMRCSYAPYSPLFDTITKKPIHSYYSMVAFNHLYQLGSQVESICDVEDLYVLASSNGKKNAMLLSNLTGETHALDIKGVDLENARFYVIDNERMLSWAPNADKIAPNEVILIEW